MWVCGYIECNLYYNTVPTIYLPDARNVDTEYAYYRFIHGPILQKQNTEN